MTTIMKMLVDVFSGLVRLKARSRGSRLSCFSSDLSVRGDR